MKLFECTNLKAGYKNIPVLNISHCTINTGDFLGIIGPNGAGKSTLLKLLARIILPLSGTIAYKNNAITAIPLTRYAAQVSAVMDIERVLPYTVESFVALGRFPHAPLTGLQENDIKSIEEAIQYCNIGYIRQKKLTELSSGELQRVNIARALAQSTQCVLLDEPVSHLDIHHAYTIMDILRKLNENGSTIIAILHDINIASEYCNRIMGIKNGEIFFDGKPHECITYQNIEALFNTVCLVYTNPLSGKPYVYPVPAHVKAKKL
ncbi:MAG: ABC transporter ATP-binding protein [Spirochaetes bacterium]|nr:ABC transporter ATP-binding protein [Spirochaetota bacterium]